MRLVIKKLRVYDPSKLQEILKTIELPVEDLEVVIEDLVIYRANEPKLEHKPRDKSFFELDE